MVPWCHSDLLWWRVSPLWHNLGHCRPGRCRGLHPPSSPFGWWGSGSHLSIQCLQVEGNVCFISDDAICALSKKMFRRVAALHRGLGSNSKEVDGSFRSQIAPVPKYCFVCSCGGGGMHRSQRSMLGVFFILFHLILLRQGLSLNLELNVPARQAAKWLQECTCPPPPNTPSP